MKYKKYFMGLAVDTRLQVEVEILILAADISEAEERYEECVNRHGNLEGESNPEIAEFWGDWDLIDRCQTKETVREMKTFLSVPVYI